MIHDSDSLHKYLTELSRIPPLTRAEEITLIPAAQAGDKQAFDKVITGNLRFVVTVANEYKDKGLPMTDLISEGNLGLFRALETYDNERGFRFITYAKWWIRQSITHALIYKSHLIRIPQSQLRKLRKIAKKKREEATNNKSMVRTKHYTNQSFDENPLSALTNFPVFKQSLDQSYDEEKKSRLIDSIPNLDSVAPDHNADQTSLRRDLGIAFRRLQKREADVLRMIFGLNGDGGSRATLGDIAMKYGISRERVRQIKNAALERLRQSNEIKAALINYLE